MTKQEYLEQRTLIDIKQIHLNDEREAINQSYIQDNYHHRKGERVRIIDSGGNHVKDAYIKDITICPFTCGINVKLVGFKKNGNPSSSRVYINFGDSVLKAD